MVAAAKTKKPKAKPRPKPKKVTPKMAEKDKPEAEAKAAEKEEKVDKKEVKKPDTVPVLLKRNYYGEPGIDTITGLSVSNKRLAGETIEVPRDDAKRLIEQGIAERADPL